MTKLSELITDAWYCRKIWDWEGWRDWLGETKRFAVLFPLFAIPVLAVVWLLGWLQ